MNLASSPLLISRLGFDPAPVLSRLPVDRPVLTSDVLATGVTWRQLPLLVSAGLLSHPVRGVYVHGSAPDTLEMRLAVLGLVVPARCVVTDRTAAWLWGATMALAPGDHLAVPKVSVFCPPGHRLRNDLSNSGERFLEPCDVVELGGVRVTTALRTACDLGRLLHQDQAMAALDSLARLRLFSPAQLAMEALRFRHYRGVVQLRVLVPLVDLGAESPMESILRLRWHAAGLPWPQTQVPVIGPAGAAYFLDIGLPDVRFGAEYDGELFHREEEAEHDGSRRAWIRDSGGWRLVVARKTHVLGRSQDIETTLQREWAAHKKTMTRP